MEERRLLLSRRGSSSAPAGDLDPIMRMGFSPGGNNSRRKISNQARFTEEQHGFPRRGLHRGNRQRSTSSILTRPRISDVEESEYESDVASVVSESEGGRSRRPYHYSSQVSLTGILVGQVTADPVQEAHYRRYQYYTRLQSHTGQNLDLLNIPDHVIPSDFFTIHIPGIPSSSDGKQSSLITIFAIWNTMMGTSLLSMPWALEQAGLAMGLFMMATISGLCLYTAHRILQVYKVHSRTMKISEFPELCGLLLGRWAEWLASTFSIIAILGAAVVYWVLMSNFLFNTVNYVTDRSNATNSSFGVFCPKDQPPHHTHIEPNITSSLLDNNESFYDKYWTLKTTPLFLIFVLYPLINFKSATFFTKFNSLGTVSIVFIFSSVMYRSYKWGINADFTNTASPQYIPLVSSSFPSLTGILALGLFIHNAIITIMENNRHQENNGRDMSLAYCLVTTTYMLLGAAFYISFPLAKSCIEDNLLNNFHRSDILTVIGRIFLFFQMTTVFPLIMYILRVSFFYPIFRSIWPGTPHILLLNASCIVICVLFAIFMPKIGTIIRFSGAACGLTIIFALPLMVYMASVKRTGYLTWNSIVGHSIIIMLGALNFIAQFFVSNS